MKSFFFLVLQIRKNNVFLFISSKEGKIVSFKSAGLCGLKDKKTLNLEIFSLLVNSLLKDFKKYQSTSFFFKIDGNLRQDLLFALLAILGKLKVNIIGIGFKSKITFNGCRFKLK